MTPHRHQRIESVLAKRQNNLTVVLENVFDPHNISAVMRSCDAVGVQEIYVLSNRTPPHKRWGPRSSSSAAKWLTVHQFTDLEECFAQVRSRYSTILTTHLGESSANLYDLDLTQSVALVFGNEHFGVSEDVRALADSNFNIPQVGMIQSLNISVACAVTLYEAYRQKSLAGHYDQPHLDKETVQALCRQWDFWDEIQL